MDGSGANAAIETALRYHEATKHSEASLRGDAFGLDWANQPRPFKIYRDLESVTLPADALSPESDAPPALETLAVTADDIRAEGTRECVPNLEILARVLHLSAGITKRKSTPGGEIYFRAYPNTGGLYHIDIYLLTGDLPDLPAGVYHFGPHDFSLHRLRAGDYRAVLLEASGDHARLACAPVIAISVSTYWRNAWKYRTRTYRHCFWDAGTLHANLIAVAGVEGLSPMTVLGFADSTVARLLGLDPKREAALTLTALGHSTSAAPAAPPLSELVLETLPQSGSEIDYPMIGEMHVASSLSSGAEAAAWRGGMPEPEASAGHGEVHALEPTPAGDLPALSFAELVRKRGSTRVFDRARAVSFEALSMVLDRATRPIPADMLEPPGTTLLELYLIVNAVDGMRPGSYYYRRREAALELLQEGNFRDAAGRLDLGQDLAADAAVNVYTLCALPAILERFGNRGYRAAQLEGGIIGGRLYLGAYAQGFGATGLTFFDDEVTEFFSPHASGKSVMFLVALGYPDRVALGLGR